MLHNQIHSGKKETLFANICVDLRSQVINESKIIPLDFS